MKYDEQGIDQSSLRGKVFKQMREDILEGKYKPGDVLRETTIAQELKVSRTPVREAIRQLELEGLVHSIPNKETVVSGITEEDVEDIYMIRSKLEGLAARKAAERMTDLEIKDLEQVLELTEFYVGKQDFEQIKELDHQFHDIIYKGTKSKTLNHMLSDFHHYIQKARKTSIEIPGRAQHLLEEHTAIYEAIKSRDGDKAEQLTDEHVQNAAKNIK